ncbi:hypothetical protein RhiirB3_448131 [Rhizophagus irregularis]|nr:hypothetical protein RhiirB3_448131 [Rhizophagus irregularis]
MAPAHAAMDQAITKRSLSSSMISMILPIVSASTQLSMCRSSQFSLHLLFSADAKLNDEAKSFRREHVAILACIPKNIKEADLLEIATQVNAKALNVPLSINSYKPKPYVYLNFSSFDTLEAAKELFVAFCGKGLTWHPPNEAHTLCHVCGRSGCSPSVCNPCPTRKVDDRLNKHRDPPLDPVIIRPHPDPTITIIILILPVPISTSTTPSNNPNCTLSQHIIDKLKAQIEKIANTFNTLEETVSWMNDTITAHLISDRLDESMMNYDNPGDSDLYPPHDNHENQNHSYDNGWDDAPTQDTNSEFNLPPHTFPSLIDTSPDASFSALDSNSVLSRRHVPLPNSRPTIITSDTTASRLQLEISSVTNVQKNLSVQLGSIMEKLDFFFPSKPSPSND